MPASLLLEWNQLNWRKARTLSAAAAGTQSPMNYRRCKIDYSRKRKPRVKYS
jgi:hypothetical protein